MASSGGTLLHTTKNARPAGAIQLACAEKYVGPTHSKIYHQERAQCKLVFTLSSLLTDHAL